MLTGIESTPFFDALRTHVIIGFFAAPEWGGNRDKVGWKLIYGGLGIDARFNTYPIAFALSYQPPDGPKWGPGFKKAVAGGFTRYMTPEGHCSSLPVESNSISLDPEVRDSWGLPVIRVTYQPHADDTKTRLFGKERMMEILDAAGAKKVWGEAAGDILPSVHLMGSCRMGNDPKTSVVNAENRSHDVPNLFMVDGSSLVTSGRQQPTATIQALAFRAADKMKAWAKGSS